VANVLARAVEDQSQAESRALDIGMGPAHRESACQDAAYLGGVITTLGLGNW
jgi:hypothetical protein